MLRIFLWKILRLWIRDVWLPYVATLLWQLTPCVGPAEADRPESDSACLLLMIMLTMLCNKRRIEDERTPLENDFSSGCEFSFGKSYTPGLEMCGSHTSLRSSVSSHPSLGSA